ncbi:hypothetical protein WR25_00155 [Diploscapter pachys]|uniref:Uncharacterized protein n=1 Tax=Diploscapter pachys TaxID=2018661 RepID=A0A2A2JLE6_9BILA|nr:hypothetical protein WR25_00155 [Diploscapter pachys]
MKFIHLTLLLLIQITAAAKKSSNVYKNSYVFLTVRNTKTGDEQQICGNYQQYRSRAIATGPDQPDALAYPLRWWDLTHPGAVSMCSESDGALQGFMVPMAYRGDVQNCTGKFPYGTVAPQHIIRNMTMLKAQSGLLIMDRGHLHGDLPDYLFGEFYVPGVPDQKSTPTFFIYRTQFNEIMKLGSNRIEDLSIIPHRPRSVDFDLSLVVIWLLAMFSVSVGGVWAFLRHRAGKDASLTSLQTESEFCNKYGLYFTIPVIIGFACGMLLLGFFFRNVIMVIFNLLLVLLGAVAIHGCIRAILSNFACLTATSIYKAEISILNKCCCVFEKPLTWVSLGIYLCCLALTIAWYVFRLHADAYILLDIINICICLHVLKTLRLPNLKWIAYLMIGMFVYDFFMVFVTPYITSDGCSIMLEVATGQGCRKKTDKPEDDDDAISIPIPPTLVKTPERFPVLMQVPHFDPMFSCIDTATDTYKMAMLGLGDIIIPGYIIVHGFTMYGMEEMTRIKYGFVCLCGYGIGLIVTFFALILMDTAQPALIYLVPCTLLPNFLYALIRGEFLKVWNGVKQSENKLIQMSNENENENGETNGIMTGESADDNTASERSSNSTEFARI